MRVIDLDKSIIISLIGAKSIHTSMLDMFGFVYKSKRKPFDRYIEQLDYLIPFDCHTFSVISD